jgi:hypothetical protein
LEFCSTTQQNALKFLALTLTKNDTLELINFNDIQRYLRSKFICLTKLEMLKKHQLSMTWQKVP